MGTKTKAKRDDSLLAGWETVPERAPSETRVEKPTVARAIGFLSLLLLAIGTTALLAPRFEFGYLINPTWGFIFVTLSAGGLLYHAFREEDEQFRRVFAVVGLLLLAAGLLLRAIPIDGQAGAWFLPVGVPFLGAALAFMLAVLRNETHLAWRALLSYSIGVVGALMAVAGFVGGNLNPAFLMGEGALLIVLGLVYLGSFIGISGSNSRLGFATGVALGAVGVMVFFIALVRSIALGLHFGPQFRVAAEFTDFLVPSGLMLGGFGLLYAAAAVAICSDNLLVVLVRREFLAFFFSPIAYLVIIGMVVIGAFQFFWFLALVVERGGMIEEPIISGFGYINFLGFISVNFLVPIITMRLLSEERRTGTMEVLLTAPLNEISVVLSKFIAAWIFFMIALAPWWINLVALRVLGGTPFDYRPMLSFLIALAVTGAGFLSMGLFFSSITRNQIIAAVLTFAGMLGLTSTFLLAHIANPLQELFRYVSYINLWEASLEGLFTPRLLFFHLSFAVFFLFLTTKVLEARKWS